MHSSISEMTAAYNNCCSYSNVATENGKRFEITSNEKFIRIRIDKCLINSETEEKCDYGIHRISTDDFYFIELKGKAVEKALDQIINTINYFNDNLIKIPKQNRIGIIISSKVPGGTNVNNLKQKFLRDYGRALEVKNRELKSKPL